MKDKIRKRRKCREIFQVLSEYLDGTLPAHGCRELRAHLKGCKPCLEYLETLERTIAACRVYAATAAPPPPSAEVREAFRRALTSPECSPGRSGRGRKLVSPRRIRRSLKA